MPMAPVPSLGSFPFGRPVIPVLQADRAPKRVFVLGVYASAVHAQWRGPDERVRVRALAVASEPSIFWRGEDVARIVAEIEVPARFGRLEPAAPQFNGPSGVALDDCFLEPLGLARADAWLCDLVPYSCVNPAQGAALAREYLPLVADGLPAPTVGPVPSVLATAERRAEILTEIEASGADVVVLLGDQPLRWFLRELDGERRARLAAFGATPSSYGRLHRVRIGTRDRLVLPVAHPRQVARLGSHSKEWFALHDTWRRDVAPSLLG
ncbi:MAG: uracil-DNA glycosylase family protein [Myxococcota bacterium]